MKRAFVVLLAIASSLTAFSDTTPPQVLVNGDFEDKAAKIDTGKVQTGFSTIPGWKDIGSTALDSGVQYGTVGDGLNYSQSGNYFVFQKSDDGLGAYQITGTTLKLGDQITLTWYAESTNESPVQAVHLLATDSASSAYSSAKILTPTNSPDLTLNSTYAKYTLTYTVMADDIGKYLGISFVTTGSNNSYAQYDNFVLTVTSP